MTDATQYFDLPSPFAMKRGGALVGARLAYETWGTLSAARDNAMFILTGLSPSAHAASNAADPSPGWWEEMIGPGKPIDTNRYFTICPNVVGACMGTTGPASISTRTGRIYGLDFPVVTIRDMVRAQAMLLDYLGIDSLFAVAGGSMGGMQVLQWAASYPERVFAALPIACGTRH